jgi:transcriptional regulator with XRE-family HTH domain
MKTRKLPLGDMNIVGANITRIRLDKGIRQKELLARIQSEGIDISGSCLSKIEGQTRMVTDRELLALARALGVDADALLKQANEG